VEFIVWLVCIVLAIVAHNKLVSWSEKR